MSVSARGPGRETGLGRAFTETWGRSQDPAVNMKQGWQEREGAREDETG